MPLRLIRKKIGELLIERNVITHEQLKTALEEQRKKGGYVSQHLISLGFASELDIANCLASQYGFAYLPLDNYNIGSEILEIIPLKLIKLYSILPVDKIAGVVTIAMADPLNDGVIEMLRQITRCDVEVFISTYSELNRAIDRYFHWRIKELDSITSSEEDELKETVLQPFIQTMRYSGRERRKYRRIDADLGMSFYLQGKAFQAIIKNVSYIGIFFIGDSFIPLDTNILCKIYLKDKPIDAVVQIARVEELKGAEQIDSYEVIFVNYGIAGFFNFITDEDKKKLGAFLKEKQQRNK